MKNELCQLLNIDYPLIQAGMVWVSGADLAAAVSACGCLGVIGAGSMNPQLLQQHIKKVQSLTKNPFAVNIPLLYGRVEEQVAACITAKVPIVITSAGGPKKFTKKLQDSGVRVLHVVSHPDLAIKCENAGVDAVVAEGFEAGGHNGRDELTTMVLTPQVVDAVKIPVVAAGGIVDGRTMAAALALGAQGVQIGTRFVAADESSAHDHFKQAIVKAQASDTKLMMKGVVPVRLLENQFSKEVDEMESRCASEDELRQHLGKGRAKKGMFEGDLLAGELEIGQASALVKSVRPAGEIIKEILHQYQAIRELPALG